MKTKIFSISLIVTFIVACNMTVSYRNPDQALDKIYSKVERSGEKVFTKGKISYRVKAYEMKSMSGKNSIKRMIIVQETDSGFQSEIELLKTSTDWKKTSGELGGFEILPLSKEDEVRIQFVYYFIE